MSFYERVTIRVMTVETNNNNMLVQPGTHGVLMWVIYHNDMGQPIADSKFTVLVPGNENITVSEVKSQAVEMVKSQIDPDIPVTIE